MDCYLSMVNYSGIMIGCRAHCILMAPFQIFHFGLVHLIYIHSNLTMREKSQRWNLFLTLLKFPVPSITEKEIICLTN